MLVIMLIATRASRLFYFISTLPRPSLLTVMIVIDIFRLILLGLARMGLIYRRAAR